MKHYSKRIITACCGMFLAMSLMAGGLSERKLNRMIEKGMERAQAQSLILAKSIENQPDALPRTFEKGKLTTCNYGNWVSGFFPGVLWQLYEYSGKKVFRNYAEMMTARVEPAKKMKSTHDLGFMLYCSFGHGYRLTGNKHYRDVINEGTQSLLTRWSDKLGVMKSWQSSRKWQYPVIIDNMMNLEMLCFMSREFKDDRYVNIAHRHAQTTMKNHYRPDYSTWHVVSYDTIRGGIQKKQTAQGYADESSWSRGQSWGLYGYTMMYRETRNPIYLEQARNVADFLLKHPRMPKDKIPYWDYDAPNIPDAKRDASAASIMASALLELSQLDNSERASEWYDFAVKQLRSLTSSEYLAEEGEQGGFIIKHGVGHHQANSEVDVPLSYGDYYYIEALLRLKKILEK